MFSQPALNFRTAPRVLVAAGLAVALGLACQAARAAPATDASPRKAAAKADTQKESSAAFQKHARKVIDEMVQEFPEYGLRIGLYKNAGKMSIPDAERRKKSAAFYQRQLAALKRFDLQYCTSS